jgi:hypothetical protein
MQSFSGTAICAFCSVKLPLFKRLLGAAYCSEGHETQDRKQQQELALERLRELVSGPKLEIRTLPTPVVEAAEAAPAEAPSAVKRRRAKYRRAAKSARAA